MSVAHMELWQRWRGAQDLAARDELAAQYLWLVRYVAGRLMVGLPPHFDQEDVEGAGCFGLLEAINRYEPERGIRFETHAIPWVRGACLKGIQAQQWAPAMRRRVRQLLQAQDELTQRLGREPSEEELARQLGISLDDLNGRMVEVGCLSVLSLEHQQTNLDGSGTTLADQLADEQVEDPELSSMRSERRELLATAIESLPDQERLVVSLIYYEGLTSKEISELLHLSAARISQIHSRAVLRLRGKLSRLKHALVS